MKLHYCDLCDCPIHGEKYLMMIGLEEELSTLTHLQQTNKLRSQDVQEICSSCKSILDRLFASRKKGLTDLVKNIEKIFDLKVIDPNSTSGGKND